jgi:RND family efflux transporter MFP subunit
VLLGLWSRSAAAGPPVVSVEAVTKPYADVAIAFVSPGRVAKVLVQEGDRVTPNQLLAQQEDDAEQVRHRLLSAQAQDESRVAMAAVDLEQKQEELQRVEWAKSKGAATDREIEEAHFAVRIAELTLRQARFEHEQDKTRCDEVVAQIERMRLYSPIAGIVEIVSVEPGESPQALTPVIRIVQNDPLTIDVPIPMSAFREIAPKRDDAVLVKFPGPANGAGQTASGRIRNISAVGDPASDTLRIRVDVPNPADREAGERVTVVFGRPNSKRR